MSRKQAKRKQANKNGSQKVTTMAAPSTFTAPRAKNTPMRTTNQKGSIRFSGSERVLTLNVESQDWQNIASLELQPGLATTFPWLAVIANSFEKYKIHKLSAVYHNLVGTQTEGNVLMSFDYDVMDSPPASAELASQSTHWCDGAPWRSFELKIPTDNRTLFTRPATTEGDPKTYDMGRLDICTEGVTPRSSLGYIELKYDLTLFEKQPNAIVNPPSNVNYGINDSWVKFTNPVSESTTGSHYSECEIITNTAGDDLEIVGLPFPRIDGFKPDHDYMIEVDTQIENNGEETQNVFSMVESSHDVNVLEMLYDFAINAIGNPLSSWSDAANLVADAGLSLFPRLIADVVDDIDFGDMILHITDLGLSLLSKEELEARRAKNVALSAAIKPGEILRKNKRIEMHPFRKIESRGSRRR
jgi:hypothetical protein